MVIVKRYLELNKWKDQWSWRLVYGRRKTGKSFFVREFTDWDRYYFVNRGGSVVEMGEKRSMDKREFMAEFFALLGRETLVVDEFHRLGGDFLDRLHAEGRKGELTLITSALSYAHHIVGSRSPLLGLVSLFRMGLVHPVDLLANLSELFGGRELVERAVFAQEPWLIEAAISERFLSSILRGLEGVRGLIGEIFLEEDRKLTEIYEAVMRAVAAGKSVSTEITNYLYSRGLLDSQQPGYVVPYLHNLESLSILWHVKDGKRRHYFHVSPAIDLYFYLTEKYGEYYSRGDVEAALSMKMGFYVEDFVGRYFEEILGLRRTKLFSPEVDGLYFKAKKLLALLEVKWREKITRTEVKEIEEKFREVESKFGEAKMKILVVPDASSVPETDLDVWDVEKLVELSKRSRRDAG